MTESRARVFAWGDLNAFFALMLDNLTNLVVLMGILSAPPFSFPADFLLARMVPGTALGVMVGDLIYTWMAVRLSRRTGRPATAMPLGLDTPSTIGVAVAVIGPVYLEAKDPMVAWQVGMATLVLIGLVKLLLSFFGDAIRRLVPQAGLLGSIAGVGVALLGFFPLAAVFRVPLVGMLALGITLYALMARLRLPAGLPGAAVAVLAGTALYYALGLGGALEGFAPPVFDARLTIPWPTLGFIDGMERALAYLPVAIPFGVLTIVGGINVNESARVAGDEYRTRDILLTEAVATILAGVCGGVAQSTPYIGHPAYKRMGARAGYTLATGLFVGLGGMFGLVSFITQALPLAAVAPVLIFIGQEIVAQAFEVCPRGHYRAVVLAMLPSIAYLVLTQPGAHEPAVIALGNGFILTAMLWGAFAAHLSDRRLLASAGFLALCGLLSLFGLIHSVRPDGGLYLPWREGSAMVWSLGGAYLLLAALAALASRFPPRLEGEDGA